LEIASDFKESSSEEEMSTWLKISRLPLFVFVCAGGILNAVTPVAALQVVTLDVQGGCPIRNLVR